MKLVPPGRHLSIKNLKKQVSQLKILLSAQINKSLKQMDPLFFTRPQLELLVGCFVRESMVLLFCFLHRLDLV